MSVNGKVIPHTPLAVDFWQVRKCPNTRLFFLSHMHSDHTVSLTSTWSNWPIYCSPTTATLLRLKLKVKEQWIHPLEVGDPYLLPLDDIGKEKLMVTLIDANHCPGAVMFLFEGYFGSILYTGDFRYTPTMLREPCLRTNATIDVLYLDNTNCDPNRSLPSRKQATQQIKEIIRSHPQHSVVIGLYALGKEALLVELAMEFKTWIEVSFERMETLIALELPDVFTTDVGAGRIRAVDQSQICRASLQQWNEEQPTLVILPTSRSVVSCHPNLHVVPYSDHSSYQELEDFVSALKPTSLAPIVGNCLPGSLLALLPSKKRHEILVPDSVRHYMLRQAEIQNCSLVYTSLRHRHFQPLAPKGVVFDSPVRGSKRSFGDVSVCGSQSLEQEACEDELDTENSEKDSECVFTDINKKLTPNKSREGAGDVCCLNIVPTVSDHMVMEEESVALPQFTQSNVPSVDIANTKVCSKSVKKMKGPFKTNAKVNVTALHKNHSIQHSGYVDLTLSNDESITVHSGNGIDQEGNIMSHDGSTSQHKRCGNDQQNCSLLTQNSPKKHLCTLCSMNELKEEYLVELENSLLNHLPFQDEDFQACDLQFHIFK